MAGGGSIKRNKKKKRNTRVFAYDGQVGGVIFELVKININDE